MVEIFSPVAQPTRARQRALAPLPQSPAGIAIGVVDNTKANARDLMEAIGRSVGGPNCDIIVERKQTPAEGVNDRAFDRIHKHAALVLVGSGD